ncbi:hypothetical protein [Chitinophaga barathri]|uniref:Uncharacterized protein n=1 Tax=Chitinophaga barathri TaxID=1647451 RepID=A0A3N4MAM3_9BACT|nr:hypothetical protein [Chitinophaga barathri]RPD40834.1 hypothetical protein EG028_12450 [Chitinophaga barathri]
MILTSLDAKYERLGARLVPLGKKLLVAISVLVVLLLLLDKLTTRPMNWTLFTIVALPSTAYALYLSYKTLYSIALDKTGEYYEIEILKGNNISTVKLEKSDVEIRVVRSPGFTMALEIQIIYQQRIYYIQKESAVWSKKQMTELKNLIEQPSA